MLHHVARFSKTENKVKILTEKQNYQYLHDYAFIPHIPLTHEKFPMPFIDYMNFCVILII